MKRIILSYTFMMILFQASTYSQTALDSVLMHLPAQSTAELQLYMDQLVDLGPSAIVAMAKNINGHLPGKYDMKEHYALSGLARYVDNQTDTETKQVIEEGFIEALNSDLDVETDVFLIEQLRSLASDKSLSTLQAKISKLCEPAIQAIAAIGSDRSIQVLIDALNTSQGYCKMVIAKAIGKTDNQTVTTALTDLLNDSDQQIKMTALNALIASGKPQAFPSILNFAKANPGTGNALLLKYGEIMAQKGNTQKLSEILDQVEAVGDA
ncbi:MAG: HEAT repeat domain-containing protein, partial [Saprospiraceae bacterium]|nr:HEAT repeat domain-containing protein [Saprospiraceae bacterium]